MMFRLVAFGQKGGKLFKVDVADEIKGSFLDIFLVVEPDNGEDSDDVGDLECIDAE